MLLRPVVLEMDMRALNRLKRRLRLYNKLRVCKSGYNHTV